MSKIFIIMSNNAAKAQGEIQRLSDQQGKPLVVKISRQSEVVLLDIDSDEVKKFPEKHCVIADFA